MNDRNMLYKLLKGKDVEIEGITVKNYNLEFITEVLGLDLFYELTSLSALKTKDLFVKQVKGLEEVSLFDVVIAVEDIRNKFIKMFNVFTIHTWEYIEVAGVGKLLSKNEKDEKIQINKNNFQIILDIIKRMYCVNRSEKEDYNAVNEEVAEAFREFEEWEETLKKEDEEITLDSIITGVSIKSKKYDLFNIWELTIFQLMMTYFGLEQEDAYDRVMSAVYAGTLDGKVAKEHHWAKKINL